MHEFGTTPEQLAQVAVTMRRHAGLNPGARFREPISVEDVLESRLIADPLHKLDCCITTDGAGTAAGRVSPWTIRSRRLFARLNLRLLGVGIHGRSAMSARGSCTAPD